MTRPDLGLDRNLARPAAGRPAHLLVAMAAGLAVAARAPAATQAPTVPHATPAASQPAAKPANPQALLRTAMDKSADPAARREAAGAIAALGPAARPLVPQLCKLLMPTPADPAPPADEALAALRAVGPEGAGGPAVSTARADVFARPPGERPVARWVPLLAALAPTQALVDAVADRNALWAETCALALEAQARTAPPASLATLAEAGPKLAAGWARAAAAAAPAAEPGPTPASRAREPALLPASTWPERRGRWMAAVAAAALRGGPAAVRPLEEAALARAKGRQPAESAAAAAAVAEFARQARAARQANALPGTPLEASIGKLRATGAPAIGPLLDLLADAEVRPQAVGMLARLTGAEPRAAQADPARARERLLSERPAAPLPLDAAARAAAASALPSLLEAVDEPPVRGRPSPAWGVLAAVAPDVPAAADALVARLPKLHRDLIAPAAAALAACDAATRAKVDSAAAAAEPKGPTADVALRVRALSLPPKQAADLLLAKGLDPDVRGRALHDLDAILGDQGVALLVELLADPNPGLGTEDRLRQRVTRADAVPEAMSAALGRPEPAVRRGALNAWPAKALTADVVGRVAPMLGDPDPAVADAASTALGRAGVVALPALAEATKSPSPAVRARAARGLSAAASAAAAGSPGGTPPPGDPAAVADALAPLLTDPDPAVLAAGLRGLGGAPARLDALLAAELAAATTPARLDRLARGLLDAARPPEEAAAGRSSLPTVPEWLAIVRRPAAAAVVRPADRAGVAVARLAASADADPAVAAAADEVILRAYVLERDRAARPPAAPTPEQAAWLAAVGSPDPTVRAKARATRPPERGPFAGDAEAAFAALSDPEADVRAAAPQAFLRAAFPPGSTPSPLACAAMARLLRMAEDDPVPRVRESAGAWVRNARGAFAQDAARVHLLARSEQAADRAAAAAALGELRPDAAFVGAEPGRAVRALQRLLADLDPAVRDAAAVAVARQVDPVFVHDPSIAYGADGRAAGRGGAAAAAAAGPAAAVIVGLLARPADLSPRARAALVGAVPRLAQQRVAGLADHADPDVRAAALLGLEQPTAVPIASAAPAPATPPVPVAVAAAGLASPAPRVRQLAARSLLTPDRADPGRVAAGARALVAAAADPRPGVHINALDALAAGYCGPRIGPAEIHWLPDRHGGERGTPPTAQERAMAALLGRCASGPAAGRVEAVGEFGRGGPARVAARWDGFVDLLEDADPQVRAAALGVARAQTKAGADAAVAAGKTPIVWLRFLYP